MGKKPPSSVYFNSRNMKNTCLFKKVLKFIEEILGFFSSLVSLESLECLMRLFQKVSSLARLFLTSQMSIHTLHIHWKTFCAKNENKLFNFFHKRFTKEFVSTVRNNFCAIECYVRPFQVSNEPLH